mmetsp:Transcript_75302/g.162833  ORF Transcript_75302/g.162833 Transcript_75302/m.162833 type:complete len:228 (-) Transcript_75302:17-700(-)
MFAHSTSRFPKSTAVTQAVEPQAPKGCRKLGRRRPRAAHAGPPRSLASSRGRASRSACSRHGSRPSFLEPRSCSRPHASTSAGRRRCARAETSLPPWPSRTAKSATSGKTLGSSICATCLSSMASRQPRMPAAAQGAPSPQKAPFSVVTRMSGVWPAMAPSTICLTKPYAAKAAALQKTAAFSCCGAMPKMIPSTQNSIVSTTAALPRQPTRKGIHGPMSIAPAVPV